MTEALDRRRTTARSDRVFFGAVAIWFLLLTLVGFGPTFFLRPFQRGESEAMPLNLVIHGVVYSAWILLYAMQSALVSTRRLRLHMALGTLSVALLLLMIPAGFHIVLSKYASGENSVTGAGFNVATLSMAFACAFAGLAYRKRPFVHKRLMLFATVLLSGAAADRVANLAGYGDVRMVRKLLTVAPGLALVAYDVLRHRRLPVLSGTLLVLCWLNFWFIASNVVFERPVGEKVLDWLTRIVVR